MLFEYCSNLVFMGLLGCSELVADVSESRLDFLELAGKAGSFLLSGAKALCVLVLQSQDSSFVRCNQLLDLVGVVGEIGCLLVGMHGLELRREFVVRRGVFLTELGERFCDCGGRRVLVLLCEFFGIDLVTGKAATFLFETFLVGRRELRTEEFDLLYVVALYIVQGSLVRCLEQGERVLRICRGTGRSGLANPVEGCTAGRSLPALATSAWA